MPFREWNFAFRESVSEFRELLREYPGTLPELREWSFQSESVCPEIGVVPRLLILSFQVQIKCGPRGGTGGAKPGSGVQRFWGPLGASEFDPSFQKFGVSETPSQRPLRAPERLSGPRGRLFRGLGEGCPFSTERENKVGHSEASKRPRFPGCPLRGFQPSGSYPQATEHQMDFR